LLYTNLVGQPYAAPFLMVRADDAPDPDPGMANVVPSLPVGMENRALFFNQAHTNAYWLKLGGTIEMSFNDPALVLDAATLTSTYNAPLNRQMLSGARVHQIIRASLTSFFNKHVRGLDDHLLDGPLPPFPEVIQFLSPFRGASGPEYPAAGLTQGSDGNLYGSTIYGGAHGAGTLFRVTPSGELTTLVSFDGTNGAHPMAALLKTDDGSLYGSTVDGGTKGENGTVFQMTPAGKLTTLLSFAGTNGSHPYAKLIQARDGHLYGTTLLGGATGAGTVFRISTAGELTTLVSLMLTNTGAFPAGALLEDGEGNFYGTTANGNPTYGGTAFKMTSDGQLTNLVLFKGANGWDPMAALVQGVDGNFYGTGEYGGNMSLNGGLGMGTVFKLTPTGVLKTLVTFTGANGSICLGPLAQDHAGNFYGTTYAGGPGGGGTIFKMTPDGVLTTLVAFNSANGRGPNGPLLPSSDGSFYGTTQYGGPGGAGTVFQITPDGALKTLVAFGSLSHSP
jgi:uncharacterized repeat protein (TIGR03803 family)